MKQERVTDRMIVKNSTVLWVIQAITYLLCWLPLRLWYPATIRYKDNLREIASGVLLVSNHQSTADPFVLLSRLPIRAYFKIIPVRFPVLDKVFYSQKLNPRWLPCLSLWGCFPVGSNTKDRMHTMFYIRSLLDAKQTVLLFPEGQISKKAELLTLKKGVDFFIQNTNQVLFVRISGFHKDNPAGEPKQITYSKVFSPPPDMSRKEIQTYLEAM